MRPRPNAYDFVLSAALLIVAIAVLVALMLWVQQDFAHGQALPPLPSPVAVTATPSSPVATPMPAPYEWRILLPMIWR